MGQGWTRMDNDGYGIFRFVPSRLELVVYSDVFHCIWTWGLRKAFLAPIRRSTVRAPIHLAFFQDSQASDDPFHGIHQFMCFNLAI